MAKETPKNSESQSLQGVEPVVPGDSGVPGDGGLPGDSDGVSAQAKEEKRNKRNKRNLVTGVLGSALKLWLRSQVEGVEHLEVVIGNHKGEGDSSASLPGDRLTNRQMLAGRIPLVRVAADGVIYQGLHLGSLQLAGRDIRMNLSQAIRGKPLKLLAPIKVDLALKMTEAQLNQSLTSPLLAPQLGEWLQLLQALLSEAEPDGASALSQPQIALAGGELGAGLKAERLGLRVCQAAHATTAITGQTAVAEEASGADQITAADQITTAGQAAAPNEAEGLAELAIETGLTVRHGNLLKLRQPCWSEPPPPGFQADLSSLAMMPLKLGSDVAIDQVAIAAGQLHLAGQLTVQP